MDWLSPPIDEPVVAWHGVLQSAAIEEFHIRTQLYWCNITLDPVGKTAAVNQDLVLGNAAEEVGEPVNMGLEALVALLHPGEDRDHADGSGPHHVPRRQEPCPGDATVGSPPAHPTPSQHPHAGTDRTGDQTMRGGRVTRPERHVHRPVGAGVLPELPGAVEWIDDPGPCGVDATGVVGPFLGEDGVVTRRVHGASTVRQTTPGEVDHALADAPTTVSDLAFMDVVDVVLAARLVRSVPAWTPT